MTVISCHKHTTPTQNLGEAGLLALGFMYWLQTEAPHDSIDGNRGYSELRLMFEVMNTPDGLSHQTLPFQIPRGN
jgi:hypothetical protein